MYATTQDLIDRFGEEELVDRTDRDGDGAYDADAVAQALADGWSEIETALLDRYPDMVDGSLERAEVPAQLIKVQCDLARARLWDDATNDVVEKNEKAALRFLERVEDGRKKLRRDRPASPATSGGIEISSGRNRYQDGSLDRFAGGL